MEPITILGFSSWIFSQVKPKRSRTPGPKFSMMMSHFFSRSTNTCLPSAVFMLTVIERLLQLSIVKYRLSAFGTSRSCPRVASPCGFSNLITSAPIHARSCEHVGPACTCVMSRIRTPLSASMVPLFLLRGGIKAGDAAALGAGGLVDHRIDERRFLRADGLFHGLAQLRGRRRIRAHAAEGLHQLVIARALHEHRRGRIAAAGVHVGALVHAVVVHDHDAYRQAIPAKRLYFHAGETEGAVALHGDHL